MAQTPIHDVAVLSVSAPVSVSQSATVEVSVEVKNEGTFDESFNVTLTDVTANAEIGMQGVVALTPGTSTTLNFNWDTTGTSLGDHTLSAAHGLSDEDATDDSAQTTSEVTVPVIGPSVNSITPNSIMLADNSSVLVTIGGIGFGTDIGDVTVTFQNGSGSTPVASVTSVTDTTTIMATVSAKLKGKKGSIVWDVVVTNSNGSDVLPSGFTVTR